MNLRVVDNRTPLGIVTPTAPEKPYVPIYFPRGTPGNENLFHPVFCERIDGGALDAKPGDLVRVFTQVNLSTVSYKKAQSFSSAVICAHNAAVTAATPERLGKPISCDPGENLKPAELDADRDGRPDNDHSDKYRTHTRGASFIVPQTGPVFVIVYVFIRSNGALSTDFIKCNPKDYCQITIERIGP